MWKSRGFVCFRNKHYIYAGYVNKTWVLLNDENVLYFNIWDKLKETLVKNMWFPTLLFYEDIDYEDESTSKQTKTDINESNIKLINKKIMETDLIVCILLI